MISETVVELSRWQFAITALFHFLFMPLNLGLSALLVILESSYVLTANKTYLVACRFWGQIFAINFALGIATRIGVIIQFGAYGSYFSHYVGDVFALPLALEILTGFFTAVVLFGPYRYGWDRLSKTRHLLVTWLMTLALHISAILVLIACGWMQNPVGAAFNYQSYRIELTDFKQLLQNPAAHAKILHTVSVCYATAAATVMAISAWILKDNTVKGNSHSGRSKTDRDRQSQFLEPQHSLSRDSDVFALYSFRSAAVMGLMSMLLVCIGDATPHLDTPTQNIKLAALTGSELAVLLPKLETKINNGIKAFSALQDLRDENKDTQLLAEFNRYSPDLGYAFLLKLWTEHVDEASAEQKELAEQFCLPAYPGLLFLMNRGMIAVGIIMLLLFAAAILISRDKSAQPPWLCKLSIYLSPLPWFACIGGWYIAIGGMQPWAVAGLIPVFLSVSSLTPINLIITLAVNCAVYALLLFIGIILIRRVITLPNTTITSGLQP